MIYIIFLTSCRQEFQSKLTDILQWMDTFQMKSKQDEIYVEKLQPVSEQIHALITEHSEHSLKYAEIFDELTASESVEDIFNLSNQCCNLKERYIRLGDMLQEKKAIVAGWISFHSWHAEAKDYAHHLNKQLTAHGPKMPQILKIQQHLENIGEKCEEWLPKAKSLDIATANCCLILKEPMKAKPIMAEEQIRDLQSSIKLYIQTSNDIISKSKKVEDQWKQLEVLQDKFATYIQQVKTKSLAIEPQKCDFTSAQKSKNNLQDLIEHHASEEGLKLEIQKLGSQLVAAEPNKLTVIQEMVQTACETFDQVHQDLNSKWAGLTELTEVWKRYDDVKEDLYVFLQNAEKEKMLLEKMCVPNDLDTAVALFDRTKKLSETLIKKKPLIENCEALNEQLSILLDGNPALDSEPVRKEMKDIKLSYAELGNANQQLSKLETQVLLWKVVENTKGELLPWLNTIGERLEDVKANFANADLVRSELDLYKKELGSKESLRNDMNLKVEQIRQLNDNVDIMGLHSLQDTVDDGFKTVQKLSDELESSLGTFVDEEKALKNALKQGADDLLAIKVIISKCEDRSGTSSDLVNRIKTLKHAGVQCQVIEPDIKKIEVEVQKFKKQNPSWDDQQAIGDVKTMQRRLEICKNQVQTVLNAILSVLEKNHNDKFRNLARIIHGLVEKIKFCDPKFVNDNFTLNSKKIALQEVEEGIHEVHSLVPEVQQSLMLLTGVLDPVKKDEKAAEFSRLINDLRFVEQNHRTSYEQLCSMADTWKQLDEASEEISGWLKNAEEKARAETINQVPLSQIPEQFQNIAQFVQDVDCCESKLQTLISLSDKLMSMAPEARAPQTVSLYQNRYKGVKKAAHTMLDRLGEVKSTKAQYENALKKSLDWIACAMKELEAIEKTFSPRSNPSLALQDKIKEIKELAKSKEGPALLNLAIELGESIVPNVSGESKDSVRNDLRNLRDKWETYLDSINTVSKRLEALQLQWSSFDDSKTQINQRLEGVKKKAASLHDLQSNLREKKDVLQQRRILCQEISSHADAISGLLEKANELFDEDSGKKLESMAEEYKVLQADVVKAIQRSENHVAEHEAYEGLVENFRDWFTSLKSQFAMLSDSYYSEQDDAEVRLRSINALIDQKALGDSKLQLLLESSRTVLNNTHTTGKSHLIAEICHLEEEWNTFGDECVATEKHFQLTFGKISHFKKKSENLVNWLKQIENQLKDTTLKSTAELKKAHLEKLRSIDNDIRLHDPEFIDLIENAKGLQNDMEYQAEASQLTSRYKLLAHQLKDLIAKYSMYVKNHQNFDTNLNDFVASINDMKERLNDTGNVLGNTAALQERKQILSSMIEARMAKAPKMEALMETAENLYVQTSPEGRETIRHHVKNARDDWDNLGDDLQLLFQNVDSCLSQVEDCSSLQAELTKWLNDIDEAIKMNTELKASLPEKKAQLQNHKIVNQEIMSHQLLVKTVCEKAQNLAELTHDNSLQNYVVSMEKLFEDIKETSETLLGRLEKTVEDHQNLDFKMKEFEDWYRLQSARLQMVDEVSGEKSEINKRLEELKVLKTDLKKGAKLLTEIGNLKPGVIEKTSDAGITKCEEEFLDAEKRYNRHIESIGASLDKLNEVMKCWKDFDTGIHEHTQWFRKQESVFRSQVLQATRAEKEHALIGFVEQRKNVTDAEKNINEFLDQSHLLLNISNVERIQPLIMQISNRYQLLHVLSKEVVNKWQGIVEDHKSFEEKYEDTNNAVDKLEMLLNSQESEPSLVDKKALLQNLETQKNEIQHKMNVVIPFAEKLYADTGSTGREKIREDLRHLRERVDLIDANITDLQKKQVSEAQQLSSYDDSLQQTLAWITQMEISTGSETPNWLSIPEIKSKMMKLKGTLQDCMSHKRVVEGVSEKAQILLQKGLCSQPREVQSTVDDINKRYEALMNNMLVSITGMEEGLELMQQWQDLQKKEQEWLKNMWEQLNLCTDYSGGKSALQSRMDRVQELQASLGEGESSLKAMNTLLLTMNKKLPAKAKETLNRDYSNLK